MTVPNYASERREPDTFDIRASARSILEATRYNWKLVAITVLATLIALTVYIMVWPPVYIGRAILMAERDSDFSRDAFYVSWNVFRKDDAKTEIELMRSGPVLREVVRRENLTYEDVHHPFLSHAAYLWGESWVGQRYRAVKKWVFPPPAGGIGPSAEEIELARIVGDMREGVSITPVGEANVGLVAVKAPTQRAASIANTLIDVYLESRTARHLEEAERSYGILDEQVKHAQQDVLAIEYERLEYTNANGLLFDFKKEAEEITKLTELEANVINSRIKLAALQASLAEIDVQLAAESPTQKASTVFELNALREQAKSRRLELEMGLAMTEGRYTEASPEIQEIRADIGKLDTLIGTASERVEKATTESVNPVWQELIGQRNAMRIEVQATRAGLAVAESSARALQARLDAVAGHQTALRAIDRRLGSAAEKYQALLGKFSQADVSLATVPTAMPTMQVVEYASAPDKKSWPRTKLLYPAALVLGLILGVALALIKSYTDGRIRREHLEGGRGNLPLYSTVPVTSRPPLTIIKNDVPRAGAG